jgi:hypothetical protein
MPLSSERTMAEDKLTGSCRSSILLRGMPLKVSSKVGTR